MAPLQVIGGGYGRTGTDSLRLALNLLGYRTHHMKELMATGHGAKEFREAYIDPNASTDWDRCYEGFDAAVDWPTCVFVKPLMAKYPEAKVILTERDAAAWYKSVKNSIFKFSQLEIPASAPPFMFEVAEMARTLVLDGAMAPDATGFFNDEERIQAMFIEHNKAIKALVPADRLLVMKTEEMSWEKLCPFLGKEIPDVPFPRANSTSELLQLVDALESKDKEFNINTFREQMNLSK